MKSGQDLPMNLRRIVWPHSVLILLVFTLCSFAACRQHSNITDSQPRQIVADTTTTKTTALTTPVISKDCYAYLTELVRSSNFPFRNIAGNKVNILVDEDDGSVLRLKLFFDTDGAGNLGWVEYFPAERRLMNTSANLEEPEKLKFDEQFAQQFETCRGITAKPAPPVAATGTCLPSSKTKLPFTESLEQYKSAFVDISCHFTNESAYLCGRKFLKAFPLASKNDIDIIAVPMDCGDFAYRYYIVAIKNAMVTDGLYAEGEFSEPGSDTETATTKFTLDEKLNLTLSTTAKGVTALKKYALTQAGKWALQQ